MTKPKLIRITTVPVSLKTLLKGQHHYMSQNGFEVVGVSSKGQELQDVHNEETIRVVELEMTRTISPIKDLKALWNFYKFCRKEKPFIVHSHTPKAGIIGMLGAKLAEVPIRLHTVAGLPLMEATGKKRKLLDFVEKLTYSCSTKVYPNSYGLKDIILKNNYTVLEKLKVIGNGSSNGINTTYFDPSHFPNTQQQALKKSLGIEKKDFIYVFVGRITGDKGVNELIQSFKEIASEHSNVKLLLLGKYEKELDPIQETTEHEIENNPSIRFAGYQNDVRPYFAISDALVFPSYREGFPNVVMQAGAMGLPSVVTDINGCNEIILEGKNGTIVPPKDVPALTKAMQRMLEDSEWRKQLQQNAREMIVSRYEQKLVWEALLGEYQSLEKEIDMRRL